jgi:YfiH family protein
MSELELIHWDPQSPYVVAFSTRRGGVSEGVFESLNLSHGPNWWRYADQPEHVEENRRRLCAALGVDPQRLTLNRQTHSARVNRAQAGRRGEPGDGLWSDEAEVPMLKLVADCVPIAIARRGGAPALAVLHAGRLGLLDGVVAAGARALADGDLAAVVGPSIGPCCYQVGEDVAAPFRARFGRDVVRGAKLDLWTAAERALRRAGLSSVETLGLCTACDADRFFSHRRDGNPRGSQGVLGLIR